MNNERQDCQAGSMCGGREMKVRECGGWASCTCMKENKETSCNCFKWGRERAKREKQWG
jgi:hypothetical protein